MANQTTIEHQWIAVKSSKKLDFRTTTFQGPQQINLEMHWRKGDILGVMSYESNHVWQLIIIIIIIIISLIKYIFQLKLNYMDTIFTLFKY